jgi:hypothetical protein
MKRFQASYWEIFASIDQTIPGLTYFFFKSMTTDPGDHLEVMESSGVPVTNSNPNLITVNGWEIAS